MARPGTAGIVVLELMNVSITSYFDELIPRLMHRLEATVRPGDEVRRIGFSQLAVVVDHGEQDLGGLAQRLEQVTQAEPFDVGDRELTLYVVAAHASADEAGPDGPLALALARASAELAAKSRQILHHGLYVPDGRSGKAIQTMAEWAELATWSAQEHFGCVAVRFEYDEPVWAEGDEPQRPADMEFTIEVGGVTRGRWRTWGSRPTWVPPWFVTANRSYFCELAERLEALEAARHDTLTGLPNRAGIALHVDTHPVCTVAIVDVDRFKSVNDELGYDEGDRLLVELAGVLRSTCSPALVGRWGGEEFVVVTDEAADVLVADLEEALRACTETVRLHDRAVTFSAGVSPVRADGWRGALRDAEAALKAAKVTRAAVLQIQSSCHC